MTPSPFPTAFHGGCQGCSMGISYPVFQGCTNLATLNIGYNVKVIPSDAFYNSVAAMRIPNREWFSPWVSTTVNFYRRYAAPSHSRFLAEDDTEGGALTHDAVFEIELAAVVLVHDAAGQR